MIELLFDRQTLRPLTEVAAQENGGELPRDFRSITSRYRDRELTVDISTIIHPTSAAEVTLHREAWRGKPFLGRVNGFDWYDNGYAHEGEVVGPYRQQRTANGASVSDPDTIAACSANAPLCSFSFPYRGAGVRIYLPFADLDQAQAVRRAVTAKIDRILVTNPKTPELLN